MGVEMESAGGSTSRRLMAAAAAVLIMVASVAEARPGRGIGGFGSRGSRTFQAPPATNTAPRTAAPIERSATQPGVAQGLQRPGAASRGGFFSRGGGFMGGFLGAGLIGALLGYGLFGGFGGLGSILGFLLQMVLIVVLARWAFRAFQRRFQPAAAGAAGFGGSAAPPRASNPVAKPGLGAAARSVPLTVKPTDYDAFEKLLEDVQMAYGRADRAALLTVTTPEMAGYFDGELDENAQRGVVNHIDRVRLLQGDLAEAWREGRVDYATVAMRFELVDHTVDRATGQTVEGDADKPIEVTELWTFRRESSVGWKLSAIQKG